jgi:hypothetical protein
MQHDGYPEERAVPGETAVAAATISVAAAYRCRDYL